MNTFQFGSTGLSVSRFALGTVELGLPYGFGFDGTTEKPTFAQAERLLHTALDAGINFIDTARAYGDSEEIIGRALESSRHRVVIATKLEPLAIEGKSDADLARWIEQSIEKSLRALRTDSLDIVLLHSADRNLIQQISRCREPLEQQKRAGHIRFFGASIYNDVLREAFSEDIFDCLQVAYSIVDRRPEQFLLSRPQQEKGVVFRSVLLRGALTQRYRSLPPSMQSLRRIIGELELVATEAGISLTEMAYRYVLSAPGATLVGTSSVEELEQALRYGKAGPLSMSVTERIRDIHIEDESLLNPGNWPPTR